MSDPTSTKTPSEAERALARGFFYRLLADLLRHPSSADTAERLAEYERNWPSAVRALSRPPRPG